MRALYVPSKGVYGEPARKKQQRKIRGSTGHGFGSLRFKVLGLSRREEGRGPMQLYLAAQLCEIAWRTEKSAETPTLNPKP